MLPSQQQVFMVQKVNDNMKNPLTGAFDALGSVGLGIVVFALILALGAIMLQQFNTQAVADYGAGSFADNISQEGLSGVRQLSGYQPIIITAIVFAVIIAVILLVRNMSSRSNE